MTVLSGHTKGRQSDGKIRTGPHSGADTDHPSYFARVGSFAFDRVIGMASGSGAQSEPALLR